MENCGCGPESSVPLNWREFLSDQRTSWQCESLLSDRARSLRCGVRDLTKEEREEQDREIKKVEEMKRKKGKGRLRKMFTYCLVI